VRRGIAVGLREEGLLALHEFVGRGQRPARTFVVRLREELVVPLVDPGVGFGGCLLEQRLRRGIGANTLPLAMPIDLSASIIALSRASHGSLCTMRSSDWKKRRS
jgi:hypothetical protein